MKTKYRIVSDRWAGFEVQVWRWWWPFWKQPYTNTHPSFRQALRFIDAQKRGGVVWTEGDPMPESEPA